MKNDANHQPSAVPLTSTGHALFVGAMTGTSLDGIEVVLLRFGEGAQDLEQVLPQTVAHYHAPYPQALRDDVLAISQGAPFTMQQLGRVDIGIAHYYTQAILALLGQARITPNQVVAAGVHGQTVFHQPQGALRFTLQLGDPNTMAVQLGIPVVADFRRRDLALGGQGAPLVCGFHDRVFRHPSRCRVVLNLGGIANITVLQPEKTVFGYDTGPANILLDAYIQAQRGLLFDADGAWAKQGKLLPQLLQQMLQDSFFAQTTPKSTGREHFNTAWLEAHIARFAAQHAKPQAQDVQRTLLELTVRSVVDQIQKTASKEQSGGEILVCGGGALNRFLLQRLAALLPDWQVLDTGQYGIEPETVEASAWAFFARRTLCGMPSSVPGVTGASRACILGSVFGAG